MQFDARSQAIESPPGVLRVLDADPAAFRQHFGHVPFALRHKLASSGLITVDRLTAIAEKMLATGRGDRLAIFESARSAGDRFSRMKRKEPFAAAVSQLERLNSWLTFVNISEVDSELKDLYREALRDVESLFGMPILKYVTRGHMNIFMASPHVITPYHIDRAHNVLCQMASEKDVWLWDPDNRANLSESEIERFYCGNMEAARYKADAHSRGREFHIGPGDALYHPPLAPHWVKNGPHVSMSVSISFETTALDRRTRIYQANRILRKVGLAPPPPGRSQVLDGLRSGAIIGIRRFKRSFRVARRILTQSRARFKITAH
jgi:hypothetical protein